MRTKEIIRIITVCALSVSCVENERMERPTFDKLVFEPAVEAAVETKGGCSEDVREVIAGDIDGLTLVSTSSEGIGFYEISEPLTKAAQYNTTGATKTLAECGLSSFKICGFNGDGTQFIPKYTDVTNEGTQWGTSGKDYYWNVSDTKTFFAYLNLPSSGASVDCSTTAQTLTLSVADAASAQNDIMMGYYKSASAELLNTVPVSFKHPMTAVVFKKGTLESITAIKSITMEGVYSSGTASISTAGAITWTPGGSTKTVSQSGGLAVGASDNVIGVPFILIPQTLSTSASVTVTIVLNDGTKDITAKLVLNSGEWKQGKTNTYTIEYRKPNLSVAVDYSSTASGVSGLTMSKTGIKAYVRAAAYIYSVDSGNLVHDTYELSSYDTANWDKGSDGFYYYKEAVYGTKDANGVISTQTSSISPLFTSESFPTVASGLSCKMSIALQAVQYDPEKTCEGAFSI